jgi:hypothetical protein
MRQWDYRKINLNDLPRRSVDIDLLNAAGENGWELVAIAANGIAYFKRELTPPAPARRKTIGSRPSDQ